MNTVVRPLADASRHGHPRPLRMLWVTLAWGSCFVAITVGLQDAPPLWLAALRALIAGVALATVAGIQRAPLPRDPKTYIPAVNHGSIITRENRPALRRE